MKRASDRERNGGKRSSRSMSERAREKAAAAAGTADNEMRSTPTMRNRYTNERFG